MVICWLALLMLGASHGGGNRIESMNAAAPSPAMASSNSSHDSSSGSSGGGVNVLAAILVTASSVMVFMAFRLSICRCSKSSSSSDDEEMDEIEANLENISSSEAMANLRPPSENPKNKKKQLSLRVDWIENFTTIIEYKDLSLSSSGDEMNLRSCSVCLSEFASTPSDEVRLLPACGHFFHPDCIDLWLISHMSCPICRRSVIPSRNSASI